jgi:REP element-mobilizing transposase RayT
MAGSYTQIYLHFVINVIRKECMLHPDYSDELCKYITGIVQGKGHTMLRINNVPDHLHMLVGFKPDNNISEFMKVVKSTSSKFINKQAWMKFKFHWMEGFGGFSVGSRKEDKDYVCGYIDFQQEHHKSVAFEEEYEALLKKYEVVYNKKYFLK